MSEVKVVESVEVWVVELEAVLVNEFFFEERDGLG
jgi:hypothetical protein